MTRKTNRLICDLCGKAGARIRKITKTFGKNKDLLVIEDIPAVSCPHCGESYYTAKTLHEIERIKANHKTLAVRRPVKVSHFLIER